MIVVYGATGYTGKLIAHELKRRQLEFVIAGRNCEKLEHLRSELGVDIEARQARIEEPQSLRTLLNDATAVINCAGPFMKFGEPVIRAAIETGTHYVDTTGEQLFVKLGYDRYDTPAKQAGVSIVSAMGFDYVPGECGAKIAAEGLEPLDEIKIAYGVTGAGVSRGTMRTGLEAVSVGEFIYREGTLKKASLIPESETIAFPQPVGKQLCQRLPSGEVITTAHHIDVRNVHTLISTNVVSPHPLVAKALPYMMPILSLALRKPVKSVLNKLIDMAPEGPDENIRKMCEFATVCTANGPKGRRKVTVKGRDTYGFTAVAIVQGAYLQTQPDFDKSGVLSPASAFDARELLDYLSKFGLSYKVV